MKNNKFPRAEIFATHYEAVLQPQYQKIEIARLRLVHKLVKYIAYFIICMFCLCISLYYAFGYHGIWLFFALFLVIFMIMLKAKIPVESEIRRELNNYYTIGKRKIMPLMLKFFGTFKYGQLPLNFEILEKSGLFPMYTKYGTMIRFDDCFTGKYKNTSVHIAERTLGHFNNDLCILLKFNKKFKSKTIVHTKKFDSGFNMLRYLFIISVIIVGIFWYMFGWTDGLQGIIYFTLAAIFYGIAMYNTYYITKKRAKFESIRFAKKWKVDTTDQVEARYILTPVFIERITQLQKQFPHTAMNFSFFDNKVMIVIRSHKNWFEMISLWHTVLNQQCIYECLYQLKSIFNIIEFLDLLNNDLPKNNVIKNNDKNK